MYKKYKESLIEARYVINEHGECQEVGEFPEERGARREREKKKEQKRRRELVKRVQKLFDILVYTVIIAFLLKAILAKSIVQIVSTILVIGSYLIIKRYYRRIKRYMKRTIRRKTREWQHRKAGIVPISYYKRKRKKR